MIGLDRSKEAAVYPKQLCEAIPQGLEQSTVNGFVVMRTMQERSEQKHILSQSWMTTRSWADNDQH